MINEIKIKSLPEDFSVKEHLRLNLNISYGKKLYYYYKLSKIGFSTFDAINILSDYFNLHYSVFSYAGLKDEDGQTEQTISSKVCLDLSKILYLNTKYYSNDKKLLLSYYGNGNYPIKIGGLEGNSFSIIIRNISEHYINNIKLGKQKFYFFNFFDVQRFGIPNKTKLTHLIGSSLVNKDYNKALQYLKKSGARESKCFHNGIASDFFFKKIDLRLFRFYLASYSSFLWNRKLMCLIKERFNNKNYYDLTFENIPFIYSKNQDELKAIFENQNVLSFPIYSLDNKKKIIIKNSIRQAVIALKVSVDSIDEDEKNLEKYKIKLSFFLPKGCYATNLIKQFIFNSY